MPVGELRDSFNSVSQPDYTCTLALLDYERVNGKEWQILRFSGNGAGGGSFAVTSEDLGPGYDLNQAARETAQRMLDLIAKGTTAT
jgi:hypothetical protein